MRILHTSDWHLGRRLYGKERRSEYEHFLDWLLGVVSSEHADSLIVSGDVFDSPTPPVWAQELYYSFLTRLRQTPCRSAVITAGNHDSAALLDAPAGLLGCLSVRVVGAPRSPQDSVFELPDSSGDAAALCCAVPFLRRRDLVTPACGQTADDILCQYGEAFRAHYAAVVSEALSRRGARDIPIIATGH
ncbi:MAG: exonuclease subunit SbcD, partial [Pyramidobacter sp.]|nr:exonuclease subunit SbcD [Pyramidobacter sp.]